LLPNQRLKRVSHCWRRQLGRGTSQAISHSGFLTAYWIFEEKHISSHGSKVKYAVNKVEQGRDRVAERQNLPLPNSSVVYTTATMPYITSIVSSSVFMLYIPTPDDAQLAEHNT